MISHLTGFEVLGINEEKKSREARGGLRRPSTIREKLADIEVILSTTPVEVGIGLKPGEERKKNPGEKLTSVDIAKFRAITPPMPPEEMKEALTKALKRKGVRTVKE